MKKEWGKIEERMRKVWATVWGKDEERLRKVWDKDEGA